jgi:hypothetical protein
MLKGTMNRLGGMALPIVLMLALFGCATGEKMSQPDPGITKAKGLSSTLTT